MKIPIDLTLSGFNLVLGGQRSGKSEFAESVIERSGGGIYIATSEALDAEMSERIRKHKERRGQDWQTIEEPLLLCETLLSLQNNKKPVLVDCLTLWISNMMAKNKDIKTETAQLCSLSKKIDFPVIFVSNEVGLAVVPNNAMARHFVDYTGIMNQSIANVSNSVVFTIAGLTQKLK